MTKIICISDDLFFLDRIDYHFLNNAGYELVANFQSIEYLNSYFYEKLDILIWDMHGDISSSLNNTGAILISGFFCTIIH